MAADWSHTPEPAGSPLSGDVAARIESIVHAAEREAQAVERAIADRRRSAEEEVQRYLAAVRLHADAEAAARAARLESLSSAARRLADELADASSALTHELRRNEAQAAESMPGAPWPSQPPAPAEAPQPEAVAPPPAAPVEPPAPVASEPIANEPTWTRHEAFDEPVPADPGVPSAARLVAIEMAVGGASRADVERHLRERHGIADPSELLDDVFGAASHAGTTLAWGEP